MRLIKFFYEKITGEKAIIGACSLVNKSVPDYATTVGVPCRIIEKDGVLNE